MYGQDSSTKVNGIELLRSEKEMELLQRERPHAAESGLERIVEHQPEKPSEKERDLFAEWFSHNYFQLAEPEIKDTEK